MTWRRAALAAVALVAAVGGWRWWHQRPPYDPEALHLRSSLEFVTYDEAQAALGSAYQAPVVSNGDQLVLGRVSWQPPPVPLNGGHFSLFLVDKRTYLKPPVFAVAAPQESVGMGSAGTDRRIADRYPWLRGAGGVQVGEHEWYSGGSRLAIVDAGASPVTFVALFPHLERQFRDLPIASAPVTLPDLLLALVYQGPDDQVYWAQRLQG
ncbi:hypothetical protein [Micromonospora robiginosa]|uniref:Uncharacterized protein n=1 Tax=Micromonospora robiginosa TaxID=2749844 RepID=A0A7L6BEW2_9ACTN|nr:hypothetical protein [Micromonospora ferruginea]QLQ40447.2 hypothetical protein H1D33_20705 [Micromonospora ferruginea]